MLTLLRLEGIQSESDGVVGVNPSCVPDGIVFQSGAKQGMYIDCPSQLSPMYLKVLINNIEGFILLANCFETNYFFPIY